MKLRKKVRKLVRSLAGRTSTETEADKPAKKPFAGSRRYWEDRYASGGNSGAGSYSKLAEFKAEVLNSFIVANRIGSVIEFGCGDGNQLLLAKYPTYTGFDVSATAVEICLSKFVTDRRKSFKLLDYYAGEKADLALSLDLIFHLVEDDEFEAHMCMLFGSATRFVIIYSSNVDINEHRHKHVRHRAFSRWIDSNVIGWSLDHHIPNRYPYVGDHTEGSFADFYIYRKMRSDFSEPSP
jgi:SAM-dependent methyltransferase